MGYSVGQVSAFAGVRVRTLHHYDRAAAEDGAGRVIAAVQRLVRPDDDPAGTGYRKH